LRFAVISDVHGNSLALDAVLGDIARLSVDGVLCLGDHVSGPMDPAGAAARLMALPGPVILGNHDRWVLEDVPQRRVDRFARSQLSAAQLNWLRAMPADAVHAGEVFLCHGIPGDDNAPWLDNFFDGRTTTLPSEAEVTAHAEGRDFPVLLCGHTHAARFVRLRDGRIIVNPGSVGMQLVHGAPDARYAIIERRDGRWSAELRVVGYDWDGAAQQARDNGFPEWAEVLTTGWAGPEVLG